MSSTPLRWRPPMSPGRCPALGVFMVGEAGVREALVAAGVAADRGLAGRRCGRGRPGSGSHLRQAPGRRAGDPPRGAVHRVECRSHPPNRARSDPRRRLGGRVSGDCNRCPAAHVIGKPAPDIFLHALARLGTPASLTAAVGDRPETDIAAGQAAGLRTIGVLTGASPAEAFAAMETPPDWVFEDMAALRRAYFGEA